jgi:hypothetical protein
MTAKMTYLIIGILLLGGLAYYLTSCNNKPNSEYDITSKGQDSGTLKVHHTETNTFNDLREMAFRVTPEQLQLSLPVQNTHVYGIIMDWGIDSATATIISYQTGDASMYLSSGGGVIGGGQHQNVNNAAKQFVNLAQTFLNKATKANANTLPKQDEVNFYMLTNKGTFYGGDVMKNFENNTSTWLPLFEEANRVITELQLTTAK